MEPMLASPGGSDVYRLCQDDNWYASLKMDGHRLIVVVENGDPTFLSRTGKPLRVGTQVQAIFGEMNLPERFVFDGEYMPKDEHYYLFDLVQAGGLIGANDILSDRLVALDVLRRKVFESTPAVSVIPHWRDTEDKLKAVHRVRERGGEGLVFKKVTSKYRPGKRSKDWVKLKFTHDVDCVVVDKNRDGKTNWALAVNDGAAWHEVGEISGLTGDADKIKVGDVVKVTCLYASDDNRLVQPVSPTIRTDKTPLECTLDQLDHIRPNKNVGELLL